MRVAELVLDTWCLMLNAFFGRQAGDSGVGRAGLFVHAGAEAGQRCLRRTCFCWYHHYRLRPLLKTVSCVAAVVVAPAAAVVAALLLLLLLHTCVRFLEICCN